MTTKFSQFAAAGALTGSEELAGLQSGNNVLISLPEMVTYLQAQPVADSLVPAANDTYSLGSAGEAWAQVYLGPNGIPVLNNGSIANYIRSPSETAAGVTIANPLIPPPEVIGVAIPDRYVTNTTPGTTPMDTGISAAISVVKALNGGAGIVQFLGEQYLVQGSINLAAANGITLRGVGRLTGGSGAGTLLTSTLTSAASFINLQGSHGCGVESMQISNTTAYTGCLLDFSGTASAGCIKQLLLTLGTTGYHLYLDSITAFEARNVQFDGGAKSVQGQNAASYSQVVLFEHCNWMGSVGVPCQNAGNVWKFSNCYWEALSGGAAGAYTESVGSNGLVFDNCWFGDCTAAGTWITLNGTTGFSVRGCEILGQGTTSTCISLTACFGFVIEANEIYNIGTFVNFAGATCRGGSVKYNNFNFDVTTPFANIANCDSTVGLNPNYPRVTSTPQFSESTTGLEISDNGVLRQWGSVIVDENGGTGSQAVAFTKNYTTLYGVKLTPNGGCTFWYSAASTSGFTINIAGATGNVTFFWEAVGV